MVLREDQAKVKALLTEAITVLCKNGLSYRSEFSVEGLLGITLDNEDVFLININETIRSEFAQALPSTPKSIPPMPHRTTPMQAPPKPPGSAGRGRGNPAGRGRPQVVNQKARKRSLEPDFKPGGGGSAPGTPTHPSPSPHSSMGSPPGTPGTPHPGQDTEQPPSKRLHEGADGDDVMIVSDGDSNPKLEHQQIKMEPNTLHHDQGSDEMGQWDTLSSTQPADQSTDPNNPAMQVPSFGDELNLGNLDPAMNVKLENAQHQTGTPTSAAPGMADVKEPRELTGTHVDTGCKPLDSGNNVGNARNTSPFYTNVPETSTMPQPLNLSKNSKTSNDAIDLYSSNTSSPKHDSEMQTVLAEISQRPLLSIAKPGSPRRNKLEKAIKRIKKKKVPTATLR